MTMHALTGVRPIPIDDTGVGSLCGTPGVVTSWNEGVDCQACLDLQCWHYVAEQPAQGTRSLLCWRMGEPFIPEGSSVINVTLLRDRVTCPRCLEWLHA